MATSTVSDPANFDELKNSDFEQKNVGTLDRRLKSRHVQFLALSGAHCCLSQEPED